MKNKIPTTIVSGFLGSGKTTIISHLIDKLQANGIQVVYIKNEIGDTDVDTQIMKNKGIQTKELLNGCICCTLVGPFVASIDEIVSRFSPDRIIIEASGAADPAALALMVSSQPTLVRDSVLSVIDVVNFEGYKDLSITAQNQTKFTDIIIFNKVELADLEQKKRVLGYVRELNSHSPIVEAVNGFIDPAVVFGIASKELELLLANKSSDDHSVHSHIEHDQLQAFELKVDGTFEKQELEQMLEQLPLAIFRSKGFVTLSDGKTHVYNTVGKRTTFEVLEITNQPTDNIFIFIGFQAEQHQEEIKEQIFTLKKK